MNKLDLTDIAISIFGDVVKEAYIIKNEFWKDDYINGWCVFKKGDIEPMDAHPVYVEFKNGKKFKIWASEWGGVTSVE